MDNTYTEENLLEQLIGNSCIPNSNPNFSSNESVGYFNNNGGNFPIFEGIIIRSGDVKKTEGQYTGENLSTTNSSNGNNDLQEISNNEGRNSSITDAAFFEFEFTPIGENLNFNYVFASNEYGEFQCDGGDLFAVFLTNLNTGEATNIATVPNDKSISVQNIRSGLNNLSCLDENEDLFSTYNVENENSTINMRGFTEILNASATVIPNNDYKITFVIADYGNSDFDSAVFIEAGSFDGFLNLGEDQEMCGGEEIILDSNFSGIDGFSFQWKKDNVNFSNDPTLSVNEPGTYSLTVTNGTCILSDDITITGFSATKPDDLVICTDDTIFNISEHVEDQILSGLNSSEFTINYYTSENDANNNINEITIPTDYSIPSNSFTLWSRIINNDTNCFDIVNFNVNIYPLPPVDSLEDVYECSEYILPTITNGNYYTETGGSGSQLNEGDTISSTSIIYIYNDNGNCSNETSFTVNLGSDFEIEEEQCGEFIIPNTSLGKFYTQDNYVDEIPSGTVFTSNTTVYFYSEDCSISKTFDININELPPLDIFDTIITCYSYTFPKITNGNYYSAKNGEGRLFLEGEVFTQSRGFYGYSIDPVSGCTNSSFFQIIIINPDAFEKDIQSCGTYIVPDFSYGNFYTDNSYQTIIPPDTEITSSQTVYFYVPEINLGTNCTRFEVNITINDIPVADSLNDSDFINCENDLPTLPELTNGKYYTESGGPEGTGIELLAGETIEETQTIYIYNSIGSCDAETSFTVTIKPLPIIPAVFDLTVNSCETYTLPELEYGGQFYTEPGGPDGTGIELFPGDPLIETQTVYIYHQDDDIETCYNEKSFLVNILETQVDILSDVKTCDSTYTLPVLDIGEYYTESKGGGIHLSAGEIISTTQTIYIYKEDPSLFDCQNESSFTVTMYTTPNLDTLPINFSSKESCGSVTLSSYSIPDVVVEYYRDEYFTDLVTPNEFNEYTITESGTRDIYVKVYPEGNSDCYVSDTISITVYPLLDFDIENGAICINPDNNTITNPYIMDTKADSTYYNIKWYLEGQLLNSTSTPSWEATTPGTYTIEATVINPSSNSDCNYNTIDVIVEGSSPKFELNILSNNFSDTYSIEINTVSEGAGEYVYAIDNGDFQTSNEFDNILPGTYNVTIRDLSGTCSDVILELIALDYQRFFTPNGDGVNDTWNINDLKNDLTATIEIYDRYGKLIDSIKTSGSGWDGLNNNGSKMQNTDYWFLLKYTKDGQQAVFRSHFSLIRK
ncbi:choice-of-anchor L domain-containing protein [Polaribacter sp. Asnod1-A03]|uniref:T9SS type B sorting domain-containing protein n=1 Tax=Polaribacter sp. Asnod1-A03 TaxID=3160581 RepID=UPI00386EC147